jgi:ribosomal protein S18 acetylase RimI-like enzyme
MAAPGAAPSARAARHNDIPQLVGLYEQATVELAPMRGGRMLLGLGHRHPPLAASFGGQFEDPRQFVVVAVLGDDLDDVVGFGTCRTLDLSDDERVGSIEDLYVTPPARRAGAGRAMAELLVRWCSSEGCTGVDASALPGSRAVKSFFESEGFTARLLVMHRPLK